VLKLVKRGAAALVGGVLVQVLIIFFLELGTRVRPQGGLPNWMETSLGLLFLFASPGFIIFMPVATAGDPHPAFTPGGRVLALSVNIAVYSLLLFVLAGCWRFVRSRLSRL
jgi:hypothetical protein